MVDRKRRRPAATGPGDQAVGRHKPPSDIDDDPSVIVVEDIVIDLRNRPLAAFLAWLIPGGGHAYQRRYTKAATFAVCILSAWIFGFCLGGQHVAYASWQPGDKRWHYGLQLGAGAVALPALVQGRRMNQYTNPATGRTARNYRPLWGGFMAPPHRPVSEAQADEVAAWYAVKGAGYEMGTWYTVIAGMLNILVIYDAYGGPLSTSISGRRRGNDDEDDAAADPENADPEDRSGNDASVKPAIADDTPDKDRPTDAAVTSGANP